jgi:hypothetical protein
MPHNRNYLYSATVESGFRPKSLLAVFSGDGLVVGKYGITCLCMQAYAVLIPIAIIDGSENYLNIEVFI